MNSSLLIPRQKIKKNSLQKSQRRRFFCKPGAVKKTAPYFYAPGKAVPV